MPVSERLTTLEFDSYHSWRQHGLTAEAFQEVHDTLAEHREWIERQKRLRRLIATAAHWAPKVGKWLLTCLMFGMTFIMAIMGYDTVDSASEKFRRGQEFLRQLHSMPKEESERDDGDHS